MALPSPLPSALHNMPHGIKDIFRVHFPGWVLYHNFSKTSDCGDVYVCEDARNYPMSGLESSKRKEVGEARRSFQTSCLGFATRAALAAGHAAIVSDWSSFNSLAFYQATLWPICCLLKLFANFLLLLDVYQWDIYTCLNIRIITKLKQTKITYGERFFFFFW